MVAWIALALSIVSLAVSIKALLDARWVEIDWNFEDDDNVRG